jgi:hypothetical protein
VGKGLVREWEPSQGKWDEEEERDVRGQRERGPRLPGPPYDASDGESGEGRGKVGGRRKGEYSSGCSSSRRRLKDTNVMALEGRVEKVLS